MQATSVQKIIIYLPFRWNSTLDTLRSIYDQKQAVVNTLGKIEDPPVDFLARDWKLMGRVIKVLQIFKDATLQLSDRDASISMVIPIVTSIISDLSDETHEDVGILGLKRNLKVTMETRFAGIEEKEHYAIATLLDAKYKRFFFRDSAHFESAKTKLVQKLVQAVTNATQETAQICRYNIITS